MYRKQAPAGLLADPVQEGEKKDLDAAVAEHHALDLELHAFGRDLLASRVEASRRFAGLGGICMPFGLPECEVSCGPAAESVQ